MTWCKIEEDAGSNNCSAQFIKIFSNYKHIGYNVDDQTLNVVLEDSLPFPDKCLNQL